MKVSDLANLSCSGCGLCVNICTKSAITLQPDKIGFLRPVVDEQTCVDCGLCIKQCIINNPAELSNPKETFAAVRVDKEKVSMSSSGGVFAAFAESVLDKGNWYVAGSILDDSISAVHALVNKKEELTPLYGSKYVQSEVGNVYNETKARLTEGCKVLFSGTPCQIAAVKRFTKNHPNLYTIEVICHGVANNKMFNSYLDKYKREGIKKFYFRDKGQGWSFNNKIVYKDGSEKKVNHRMSSYMTYFLNGETYRESCYHCPYAKPERGADITIGDFWGIIRKRADLKESIDIEKGVSCLLINTSKGKQLVEEADIELYPVAYEDIKDGNEPLNHPSIHTQERTAILDEWSKSLDWTDVDSYWKKHDSSLIFRLWSMVPMNLQHKIRVLLGKR